MTRHHHHPPSSTLADPRGHVKRFAMVALSALIALVLALATSFAPAAFAQGGPKADSAAGQPAIPATDKVAPAGNLAPGQISGVGSATVLVYLNGSDLESEAGEATADIAEMIASGVGDNVNVIIETLGTRAWQDYGIASNRSQRYRVNKGTLELVDDSLGQLDTTSADTLSDFISWGTANYPADRYILLFWDHGAGPVYGFGYDEFQDDYAALTLDEIQQALAANSDVHFDIIGMDCCIMSSLETCYVLQPYCDYAILSEDFEPGIGWRYTNWMRMLEQNPGVGTVELGRTIVDDMIGDVQANPENGEATLALIDESAIGQLYDAWIDFAYANQDQLLGTNYSQEIQWRDRPTSLAAGGRAPGWEDMWSYWDSDASYVTMTDYYVTDLLEVASSIESDQAATLQAAAARALVHYGKTSGETALSGLGVTLPYGDAEFYDQLVDVFSACGIDKDYIDWLSAFVDAEGASNYYDYQSGTHAGNGPFGSEPGSGSIDWYGPGGEYGSDSGYGPGGGYDFGSGYGQGDYYSFGDDYYPYDEYGYEDEYGYGYGFGDDSSYGHGHGYNGSSPYHDYPGSGSNPHAGNGYGSGSGYGYGYGRAANEPSYLV